MMALTVQPGLLVRRVKPGSKVQQALRVQLAQQAQQAKQV